MAQQPVEVPAYSQFLDVTLPDWQHRACGIVALKTVMDFLGAKTPDLDKLIKIGLAAGAYDPSRGGWVHQKLAEIAWHRYYLRAAPYDWSQDKPVSALRKLKWTVRRAPCLASVYKDFEVGNGGGHLIVVKRVSGQYVFYHETKAKVRHEIRCKIKVDAFLNGWKRRGVIVVK